MIFALIAYFIAFTLFITFHKKGSLKYEEFPTLNVTKDGITFYSTYTHRVRIDCANAIQVGNMLYVKTQTQLIIITNVKDGKIYQSYLYFTCFGKTQILFNTDDYYRYFMINVQSNMFDIRELKKQSILDIMDNDFDFNNSEIAKKYLKILTKILNITITDKNVQIKPNKYKLTYQIEYKINNKIKRVIIK